VTWPRDGKQHWLIECWYVIGMSANFYFSGVVWAFYCQKHATFESFFGYVTENGAKNENVCIYSLAINIWGCHNKSFY